MLSWLFSLLLLASAITRTHAWETVEEAAAISRRILATSSSSVGTMATVFPDDHPTLAGQPYAMQEYYANCYTNGSLALIFLPISRHSRNILHSPTRSASISVWSDPPAAAKARVSLMGTVEIMRTDDPDGQTLKECYLNQHPDAVEWIPGDDEGAHLAYWARFDPHTVYFVGGFGDEHYIGYIPLEKYQAASPKLSGGRLFAQQERYF
ncbi:pyridoxamine 5'-phosphate oxidase-domain-containing protein [Amylostereum chailletii]|nr:pyridoxamine 5'-phosphate oxidase-domain-containing protein [Amylostereum chailletii]